MEDFTIKVQVAQRVYPIKIKREDEENVRKAAKMINERIKEYEQQYSVKDKLDLVAMCALQITTELLDSGSDEQKDLEQLSSDLKEMDQKVSQVLG